MGFLDKLVKSAVQSAVGEVVQSAAHEVAGKVTDALGIDGQPQPAQPQTATETATTETATAETATAATAATAAATGAGLADKAAFREMLAAEFADLSVKEDVPVSELGGAGKPYDFGLYRGGKLAGVVMLTEHNRDNNQAFKGAKAAAQAAGVPFINFYLHMPNERAYAVSRIRSFVS
ncbi:MAG: hypothetical protein LBQ92_02505 [Propionibacteriaceae bacterium]|jgi:hypothetical protein|nr:hypothetical protein [Propionibacteriaceae bacterium]